MQSSRDPPRASRRTAFSRTLAELTMRGRRAKEHLEVGGNAQRRGRSGLAATAAGGRATSTRRRQASVDATSTQEALAVEVRLAGAGLLERLLELAARGEVLQVVAGQLEVVRHR